MCGPPHFRKPYQTNVNSLMQNGHTAEIQPMREKRYGRGRGPTIPPLGGAQEPFPADHLGFRAGAAAPFEAPALDANHPPPVRPGAGRNRADAELAEEGVMNTF